MPSTLTHILSNVVTFGVVYAIAPEYATLTTFLVLVASNAIDIDHLLAKPIYDKNRSSIHFHALHKLWLMPVYILGVLAPYPFNVFFVGVLLHLALDEIETRVYGLKRPKTSK